MRMKVPRPATRRQQLRIVSPELLRAHAEFRTRGEAEFRIHAYLLQALRETSREEAGPDYGPGA